VPDRSLSHPQALDHRLSPRQEATVKALGSADRQSVTHDDSVTVRGMIAKVPHVLEVTREA